MEKKLPRRGFLGLVTAAPFAAREMIAGSTDAAVKAAGANVLGTRAPRPWMPAAHRSKIDKRLVQLLTSGQEIPEKKRREWLEEARSEARTLDPDIAAMRSVSLSVKIAMQTERYYGRQVEAFRESPALEAAWNAFKKSLDLPEDTWED